VTAQAVVIYLCMFVVVILVFTKRLIDSDEMRDHAGNSLSHK